MSVSLEFFAGDADAIGAGFAARDFEGLRSGRRSRGHADFSLQLSPTDLDVLSEVVAERTGAAPVLLNDSFTRTVAGNGNENGAVVVDPAWVRMMAAADDAAAGEIAEDWVGQVGRERGERLEVTAEAITAVRDLIRLCRTATSEALAVVHAWRV